MKKDLFDKTKVNYGFYSSFAIWDDNNIEDVEYIERNLKYLHGRVVFVAYNASAQIKEFQNFHFIHQGGRDSWLAKTLGKHPFFRGSYMTDFFKGDFAKKENGVIVSASVIEKNKKMLEEEIKMIGQKNCVIVAIGRKSEKIIRDCGMKCEYIPHYAGRISRKNFEIKVLELGNRLRDNNNKYRAK